MEYEEPPFIFVSKVGMVNEVNRVSAVQKLSSSKVQQLDIQAIEQLGKVSKTSRGGVASFQGGGVQSIFMFFMVSEVFKVSYV